jgi:hypothetical protein
MFVRRLKHKNGRTYIQAFEKVNKKYVVKRSFGSAYPDKDLDVLVSRAKEWTKSYKGIQELGFENEDYFTIIFYPPSPLISCWVLTWYLVRFSMRLASIALKISYLKILFFIGWFTQRANYKPLNTYTDLRREPTLRTIFIATGQAPQRRKRAGSTNTIRPYSKGLTPWNKCCLL